jgi:uncharacterized protein YggU (UPF0235/DUF167 family)
VSRAAGIVVVIVKPGAQAPGIVAGPDASIIIRVRERAIDGRANEAVRAAIGHALGVPIRAITLVRGATARMKAFAVDGMTSVEAQSKLLARAVP